MKVRYNSVLISAVLWTLCLMTMIPTGMSEASTWRELYIDLGSMETSNVWATFGFAYLGIATIGLIVLWTGYRKRERWAWFVMLLIFLCFDFPSTWMPVLLQIHAGSMGWTDLLHMFRTFGEPGWWPCLTTMPSPNESVGIECFAVGELAALIRSLVMLVALLLPVKAFFWKSASN
ncbi:MAG TPA: hypothetical protein VFU55_11485 [Terracidiphilus sp.]|nr:hypothetical protein [Terracidiphilus sp.]